ncbi:hypothetical protein [Caulobacter sp. 17J80-11]|uniref:hypothetical protein n=1 Tax=Caulobacter sp. 17J80-11 TaxID=2763502 RepID=UPI0016536BAE|nr:hypothetical protein [Caulobacter sp. 17J80-11]MBC6980521.1 hypothetical protein [Caulobacter sp. 17J80-11]
MKKLLAIATIAALFGGGSAFAADSSPTRLDDTQMDNLTAGKNGGQSNFVIIAPITNVDLNNIAIGDGATAISTVVINNIIYVVQVNLAGGGNGKGNAFGQLKKLGLTVNPNLVGKSGKG